MNDSSKDPAVGGTGKLILIDGNSVLYRAFYALPTSISTSSGQVTNAVYGFVSMLIKLINMEKPDAIIAAFDKGKTFRIELYEEYKAHRPPTSDELIGQFPMAREVLNAMNIPVIEIEGYEADDILATLAKKANTGNINTIIVTSDRDAFQLISPNIKIMTMRKGITDIVIYDEKKLHERYGIPPERIIDMISLKGDPSDNIPGVPGIGEKTAMKLVQEFGTLENILNDVDKITPQRAQNALKQNKEQAILSKKIATMEYDLNIDIDLRTLKWAGFNLTAIRQVFNSLEFRTLLERIISKEQKAEPSPAAISSESKVTNIGLTELKQKLSEAKELAFEFGDNIDFFSFSFGTENFVCKTENNLEEIINALNSSNSTKYLLEFKSKYKAIKEQGFVLSDGYIDTSIAVYIQDPSYSNYPLEQLKDKNLVSILKLSKRIIEDLEKKELLPLLLDIEMPLSKILAKMELTGVSIDCDYLNNLSDELSTRIKEIREHVFEYAGGEFNLNSPQQLSEVLFDKLGLKPRKKTKTGLATGASILLEMKEEHPVIPFILEYRELAKLKGTYLDTLPKLVNPNTNRLHTTYNQTSVATGRLSSTEPNLQNIPIRTEIGQKIRKAFIPKDKNWSFIIADYKQIELRLLAYLSNDENLIKSFESGEDIHSITASEVFGVAPEDVTPALRRNAKAVNFGIVYGISPRGLATQLGNLPEEAQEYIDLYFDRFPKVKKYITDCIVQAYQNGYTKTILNRRRYLPELQSSVYRVRTFGERLAVNTPLQGSAADVIKLAMVNLDKSLSEKNLKSRLIMQIHDELIVETLKTEENEVINLVRNAMEECYPMKPRLEADIKVSDSWFKS